MQEAIRHLKSKKSAGSIFEPNEHEFLIRRNKTILVASLKKQVSTFLCQRERIYFCLKIR